MFQLKWTPCISDQEFPKSSFLRDIWQLFHTHGPPWCQGRLTLQALNLGSRGFEVSREEVLVANTQRCEAMLDELLQVSLMMILVDYVADTRDLSLVLV